MRTLACVYAIAIFIALCTLGASARVIGGDLDNAVAVYYFNSLTDSGNVYDNSGNRLHGTLYQGAELKTVSDRKALSLDYSSAGFFQAMDNNKPLFVNKAFSIFAWVKIPSLNGVAITIYAYNPVADAIFYPFDRPEGTVHLDVFPGGSLHGYYGYNFTTSAADGNFIGTEITDRDISNNRWQHIAVVIDSTSVKLYLNGTRIADESVSGHQPFGGIGSFIDILIAGEAGGSVGVDDLGFFKNDFTDAQVRLIYNRGLANIISIASVDPGGKVATTWGELKQR